MHTSALLNAKRFFDAYAPAFNDVRPRPRVIEIGSRDINGSLRQVCPAAYEYVGLDFEAGKGVDVVLDDPYALPFDSGTADIVLSSSCLEHSEMFWLLFLEVMRILKPGGLFYLNVPSNGDFHRYPVDCWRFYPDSGRALVTWARRNALNPVLLESYVGRQEEDIWNDYVAVFLKDASQVGLHTGRILQTLRLFTNGMLHGSDQILNASRPTEDRRKLGAFAKVIRATRGGRQS